MALRKFELKEEHLKLIKHLKWAIAEDNSLFCEVENNTPYGGLSLIEDAGLILYGKPEGEFDPLSPYGATYTKEEEKVIQDLYDELPMALSVINYTQKFEVGHYKAKWPETFWRKYTPKNK